MVDLVEYEVNLGEGASQVKDGFVSMQTMNQSNHNKFLQRTRKGAGR